MNDTPEIEKKDIFTSMEMTDRAVRKAEKEQKRLAAKSAEKTEVEENLSKSTLGKKQINKKKRLFKWAGIAAGLLLFVWIWNYLFTPYKGDARFGICKVFLENSVRYPQHLHLSTVEDFGTSIRLWFAQTDAFGAYRMENIQCFYKQDDVRGTYIEKITFNRRPVDQKKVEEFNGILHVVLQNLPDLTYPEPLPDSLQDLQILTDMFRKPLNIR